MTMNFSAKHIHESDFDSEVDDISIRVSISSLDETITASQLEDALLDGMVSDDLHLFAEHEAMRDLDEDLDEADLENGIDEGVGAEEDFS